MRRWPTTGRFLEYMKITYGWVADAGRRGVLRPVLPLPRRPRRRPAGRRHRPTVDAPPPTSLRWRRSPPERRARVTLGGSVGVATLDHRGPVAAAPHPRRVPMSSRGRHRAAFRGCADTDTKTEGKLNRCRACDWNCSAAPKKSESHCACRRPSTWPTPRRWSCVRTTARNGPGVEVLVVVNCHSHLGHASPGRLPDADRPALLHQLDR